jgi:hypothetical protein
LDIFLFYLKAGGEKSPSAFFSSLALLATSSCRRWQKTEQRACDLWASLQTEDLVPEAIRLYDEFPYTAGSRPKPWRVLLKAEVMALGENPRFVVTSLNGLDAGMLYEDVYCARGQTENFIKHLKNDLASDRTSCTSFLANFMRLLWWWASSTSSCSLRSPLRRAPDGPLPVRRTRNR